MKCLGLNENNDLFIENGNLKMFLDIEALAQIAMNIVQTTKEEIFLHPKRGIPYFEILFNNKPKIQLLIHSITTALKEIKQIENIEEIKIIKEKNLLKYSLNLDTIYGRVETNG